MRFCRRLSLVLALSAMLVGAFSLAPSQAFERMQSPAPKAEMMENCPGLIAAPIPRVIPAAFKLAALKSDEVRLSFVGHATFLIESPRGIRIATDYNDYVRPSVLPDIATMNHAHSTHYTDHPDPKITHVLRGWASEYGKPVRHDLTLQDVRVRNVPTNIRDEGGGTERHGNSIFVFEIANMCIAHLGHLHHTLSQQQMNELGRIDAVMVPVDGSWTLDIDGMVEVIEGLKAPLIIPMHYFSGFTLNRFLDRMRDRFDIETSVTPSVVISKATLPVKPKVLVLPGR